MAPEPQSCCGRTVAHATGPSSALLFDARPGPYSAAQFTHRSEWPSTLSYYSPGELIFYRERFIDHQGRAFGGPDYFHRRAESVRVGAGYR